MIAEGKHNTRDDSNYIIQDYAKDDALKKFSFSKQANK